MRHYLYGFVIGLVILAVLSASEKRHVDVPIIVLVSPVIQ